MYMFVNINHVRQASKMSKDCPIGPNAYFSIHKIWHEKLPIIVNNQLNTIEKKLFNTHNIKLY